MKKLLFFVGLAFVTGFIWGKVFSPDMHYSDPQIPLGQYDQIASVYVIRKGDDIWIVEHRTGRLIFKYNQFKEVDKEAFGEYEDLLVETLSEEK